MSRNNNFKQVAQSGRSTKQVPTYNFANENLVDDEPTVRQAARQKSPLYQKWGNTQVVTASFNLLMSFATTKLASFTHKSSQDVGDIVDWAKTILDDGKFQELRDRLYNFVDDVTFGSSAKLCGSKRALGCQLRHSKNENGDTNTYAYSHWLQGRNEVPDNIRNDNTLTLAEAHVDQLFDQIYRRLERLSREISKYSNCATDMDFQNDIDRASAMFLRLRNEATKHLETMNKLKATSKSQSGRGYQTPLKANVIGVKPAPGAPKKMLNPTSLAEGDTSVARKLNFDDVEPPKPKPLPPKPVMVNDVKKRGVSFADMLSNPSVKKSDSEVVPEVVTVESATTNEPEQVVATEQEPAVTKTKAQLKRAAQKLRKAQEKEAAKSASASGVDKQ